MVIDQFVELMNHYVSVSAMSPPDQSKVDNLFNEIFPFYLNLFEALIQAQGTVFFAANQITWVSYL
jgi:hypothetical protein